MSRPVWNARQGSEHENLKSQISHLTTGNFVPLALKPISGIRPPVRPPSPFADGAFGARGVVGPSKSRAGMGDFANLLADQVKQVNSMQTDAAGQVHSLLTGGDVNEAEVLTSVQKADLAFRMLLQVRNKLIEAYREVQQIQI